MDTNDSTTRPVTIPPGVYSVSHFDTSATHYRVTEDQHVNTFLGVTDLRVQPDGRYLFNAMAEWPIFDDFEREFALLTILAGRTNMFGADWPS